MIAAGLPRFAGVITVLLLLNPNCRFGEEINAAEVIPVRMADDDVRDFFRLDAGELHRLVGTNVFCRWEVLEEGIAVIAAVKEDVATAATNEPDNHDDGDFFAFWSAHNEAGNLIVSGGVANRLNGVLGPGNLRGGESRQ